MEPVKHSSASKVAFVEMLKIIGTLSDKPTHAKTIMNSLAIHERTFYRRINDLRHCGVQFGYDEFGRYKVISLPLWIKNAINNLTNTQTHHD